MTALIVAVVAVYAIGLALVWLAWFWMHTWPLHAWEDDPDRAFWRLVWRRLTFRGER